MIRSSSKRWPILCAAAHGVFEQHGQAGGAEAGGGFRESESERGEPMFERLIFVIARMQYQVFRADGFGAIQFAAKGGDGFLRGFPGRAMRG